MEFDQIRQKRAKVRNRNKGLDFERWCAIQLRKVFPEAKRHLEFQKAEAKGIDLDNTGDYRIQCKKYKGYAPISCIEEVQCDEWLGEVPILITAGTDKPPLVVMPFGEFIRLIGLDNG